MSTLGVEPNLYTVFSKAQIMGYGKIFIYSSFVKIMHPPDKYSMSRFYLNNIIIAQVCLGSVAIRSHSKMCSFKTQYDRCCKFRLIALTGVLTWLQLIVVTNLSEHMLNFDDVWHFREVLSSLLAVHCTRQVVDSMNSPLWVSVMSCEVHTSVLYRCFLGGGFHDKTWHFRVAFC